MKDDERTIREMEEDLRRMATQIWRELVQQPSLGRQKPKKLAKRLFRSGSRRSAPRPRNAA